MIEGRNLILIMKLLLMKRLKKRASKVGDKLSLSQSDEKLKIVGFSESAKYNASPVIFSSNSTIEKN